MIFLYRCSGINYRKMAPYEVPNVLITRFCIVFTAVLSAILLWTGSYKIVERFLVFAVAVMTFIFLVTAVAIRPSIAEIMKGLLMPSVPPDSIMTVVGLIGTTVFTYAFFMQSSAELKQNGGRQVREYSCVAI